MTIQALKKLTRVEEVKRHQAVGWTFYLDFSRIRRDRGGHPGARHIWKITLKAQSSEGSRQFGPQTDTFLDGQLGPGSPTVRGPICIEPQVNGQVLMKLFLPQNTCSIRKQLPQKDQEKKHNWHLRRMMSQVQPGQQFLGNWKRWRKKHPVSDYFFDKLLSTSCCFLQNLRSW